MTPAKSKYKPDYHERRKYDLDKFRTWIRLSSEELKEVAGAFATKLNQANGPVCVVVPQKGWSSVDSHENPTYDPQEDQVFVDTLREQLNSDVSVVEIPANMEDEAFAQAIVKAALEIF